MHEPEVKQFAAGRMSTVQWAVLLVALLSLFGTVTNLVPLSTGLALPALAAPFLLLARRRVPRVSFALGLLLAYFLIWTALYHPLSLAEYGFFRRDGNVFITFAPLLLLSLLRLKLDLNSILRRFLLIASGLNGVFLLVFLVTGGTIFFYEEGIYHFLFYAHNAAGGFLAVLTALSFGYYHGTRERMFLVLTLLNLAGLLATASRGSLLGLLGAVFIVLVLRRRFTGGVVAGIVIMHLLLVPLLYRLAPPLALGAEHPAVVEAGVFEALPRAHTIAIRAFYLWPRAWHLFLESPLIGTGFGSYNDLPYNLEGLPSVVQVNRPGEVLYNDSHAHHTFLHVLAETGVLGLALLLYLLVQMRRFILRIREPVLQTGLHLVFWLAVLSSCTEHRLFTPSQMLPFTILLGLAVAHVEYLRCRARSVAASGMRGRELLLTLRG